MTTRVAGQEVPPGSALHYIRVPFYPPRRDSPRPDYSPARRPSSHFLPLFREIPHAFDRVRFAVDEISLAKRGGEHLPKATAASGAIYGTFPSLPHSRHLFSKKRHGASGDSVTIATVIPRLHRVELVDLSRGVCREIRLCLRLFGLRVEKLRENNPRVGPVALFLFTFAATSPFPQMSPE